MAQHGARLDLLVLLADVKAVHRGQLYLVSLDLPDAVDHARRTHLAEEPEVQLLQVHVLLGFGTILWTFQC